MLGVAITSSKLLLHCSHPWTQEHRIQLQHIMLGLKKGNLEHSSYASCMQLYKVSCLLKGSCYCFKIHTRSQLENTPCSFLPQFSKWIRSTYILHPTYPVALESARLDFIVVLMSTLNHHPVFSCTIK
jgi:hypothetical protein